MQHTEWSEEKKLERIFNSQSDYQCSKRRKNFTSLAELLQLTDDLEYIR